MFADDGTGIADKKATKYRGSKTRIADIRCPACRKYVWKLYGSSFRTATCWKCPNRDQYLNSVPRYKKIWTQR